MGQQQNEKLEARQSVGWPKKNLLKNICKLLSFSKNQFTSRHKYKGIFCSFQRKNAPFQFSVLFFISYKEKRDKLAQKSVCFLSYKKFYNLVEQVSQPLTFSHSLN